MIEAAIFDMDGVLIDSEQVWDTAREQLVTDGGGTWHSSAQRDMMGMSSKEWSVYMRDELQLDMSPTEINDAVVARMRSLYDERLPTIPGAVAAVERLGSRWPLGLASSSNRPLIDLVLDRLRLAEAFSATVSSEEVGRGKPAPDVFVEAARRLGVSPEQTVTIEDSHNGILAAKASGAAIVAIPNPSFRPQDDALAEADVVIESIAELTVELCERLR